MNTLGIDLKRAAHHLQESGIETGDRKLREHLVDIGAIRKTLFGYEVTPDYKYRGLLVTQSRQHTIETETGQQIPRHYTVVLVTGDGLSWLRSTLQYQQKTG